MSYSEKKLEMNSSYHSYTCQHNTYKLLFGRSCDSCNYSFGPERSQYSTDINIKSIMFG